MIVSSLDTKVDLAQFKAEYLPKIEGELSHLFDDQKIPLELKEAMSYSLMAGGKRIRPLLTLLVLSAFARTLDEEAIQISCVVELVHTYSLIHDDLPAMDNDNLRRGKPTNHIVYGEGLAILAGDALLTQAFELLATLGQYKLIEALATAAGSKGMVAGQVLDLSAEGQTVSLLELQDIHSRKTGSLLMYAVYAGFFLSSVTIDFDDDQEENSQFLKQKLLEYGAKFGLAFQIRDDLLDITSTTTELGKTAGKDAKQEKSTYVQLYGIDKSKHYLKQSIQEAVAALETVEKRMQQLKLSFDSRLLKELVYSLEV